MNLRKFIQSNSRPTFVLAGEQIRRIGFRSFCIESQCTRLLLFYDYRAECVLLQYSNSKHRTCSSKKSDDLTFLLCFFFRFRFKFTFPFIGCSFGFLFKYNFLKIDDKPKTLICGYIVGLCSLVQYYMYCVDSYWIFEQAMKVDTFLFSLSVQTM